MAKKDRYQKHDRYMFKNAWSDFSIQLEHYRDLEDPRNVLMTFSDWREVFHPVYEVIYGFEDSLQESNTADPQVIFNEDYLLSPNSDNPPLELSPRVLPYVEKLKSDSKVQKNFNMIWGQCVTSFNTLKSLSLREQARIEGKEEEKGLSKYEDRCPVIGGVVYYRFYENGVDDMMEFIKQSTKLTGNTFPKTNNSQNTLMAWLADNKAIYKRGFLSKLSNRNKKLSETISYSSYVVGQ